MATIQPTLRTYELKVSPYERVASMVLALLALVGTVVSIMLILWLTSQIFASRKTPPVLLEDIGTGDTEFTGGTYLDAPMAEELGMETDLEEATLEETLTTVADAVASQLAMLDDPALTEEMVSGKGGRTGDGRGLGLGSGPGGTGKARRWEVRFPPGNTLDTYRRQLDHFGIVLGVMEQGGQGAAKVLYASGFTQATPTRSEGPSTKETRYYLTWRTGGLQEADLELLASANINGKGKLILKFIPPELEETLKRLETTRAGDRAKDVRTTRFGIRPKGSGFEFYVIDQTYK